MLSALVSIQCCYRCELPVSTGTTENSWWPHARQTHAGFRSWYQERGVASFVRAVCASVGLSQVAIIDGATAPADAGVAAPDEAWEQAARSGGEHQQAVDHRYMRSDSRGDESEDVWHGDHEQPERGAD